MLRRPLFVALLAICLALPAAAIAQEKPSALPKVTVGSPDHGKKKKDDDAEAVDEAPEKLPEGMVLGEDDVVEVYIDNEGKIYKRRRYQGVVPRLQDKAAFSEAVEVKQKGGRMANVVWVGFQKLLAASRVFIKTDRVVVYTLYKPDPNTIIVEFPSATVPLKNTMRELQTEHFETPVKKVNILEDKKTQTVRVRIDLNPAVSYIYRQDGPYVYIDVER